MVRIARIARRIRMVLAYGRELIDGLESSGLSQSAFAESLGIAIGTIQYRRRRVRQSSEFVAIYVVEENESHGSGPKPWTLELDLGRDRAAF